jgi:hypothetical protein
MLAADCVLPKMHCRSCGAFGVSINSPSSFTDGSVEEVVDPEDPFRGTLAFDAQQLFFLVLNWVEVCTTVVSWYGMVWYGIPQILHHDPLAILYAMVWYIP